MTLALLVGRCEEELICDMAETYHVFNWRELPLRTAAILANGLHQDSRCFRKMNGQKLRSDEYVNLAILDELRVLVWLNTKDAAKGKNQPESILKNMLEPKNKKVTGFRTAEEFEARRKLIIARAN